MRLQGFIFPHKEEGKKVRIGRDIYKVIFRVGRWHLVWRLTDNGITY